jgi:BirA family biotin operon repressor/biotin-[acetyl-CoA-carboxylase] ligase
MVNGRDPVLRAFSQASSYVRGRRVVVEQNGTDLTGITDGLDPQGFLILREDSGRRTLILAGGVRPA